LINSDLFGSGRLDVAPAQLEHAVIVQFSGVTQTGVAQSQYASISILNMRLRRRYTV